MTRILGETNEPSLELFRQLVQERTGGMNIELTDAPWLSLYRANVQMVSHYSRLERGRKFRAGVQLFSRTTFHPASAVWT